MNPEMVIVIETLIAALMIIIATGLWTGTAQRGLVRIRSTLNETAGSRLRNLSEVYRVKHGCGGQGSRFHRG
jgi:hypothetical protein